MIFNAVLFDLDGTLIDSRLDLAAAVNMMREHYGLPTLSVETVVSYIGDGMTKLVERSIANTDIVLAEAVRITKKFYGENLVVHTVFYEGVIELLQQLQENGIKIALTSNKPVEFCREILQTMKVDQYFSAVYGGCDNYALKPAPDMIELAAAEISATTDKCIVVGDNWTDIEAGKNAGSFTCFYNEGLGKVTEVAPDFSFDYFSQLEELLRKNGGTCVKSVVK